MERYEGETIVTTTPTTTPIGPFTVQLNTGWTIAPPTPVPVKPFNPVVQARLEAEHEARLDRFSPYRHYTPQQHIERRRQDRADRKRRNACHGGAECFGKWLAIVKLSVPFVLVVLWLFRVI